MAAVTLLNRYHFTTSIQEIVSGFKKMYMLKCTDEIC